MAANFTCSFAALCCLAVWGFSRTSGAAYIPPPHSTTKPGFPVPVNTNNPGVRKAARFGVYRYNNSSNDLFLFKESQINKAMVQIVRGLKYMLHVEIGRTVCEKREHSSLDSCHFQRKKNLQRMYKPPPCRARGVRWGHQCKQHSTSHAPSASPCLPGAEPGTAIQPVCPDAEMLF